MRSPFGWVSLIIGIVSMTIFFLPFYSSLPIFYTLDYYLIPRRSSDILRFLLISILPAIIAIIFGGIGIGKDDPKVIGIMGLIFGMIVIGSILLIIILGGNFSYTVSSA